MQNDLAKVLRSFTNNIILTKIMENSNFNELFFRKKIWLKFHFIVESLLGPFRRGENGGEGTGRG